MQAALLAIPFLIGALVLEAVSREEGLLPAGVIAGPVLLIALALVIRVPTRRYNARGYQISADRLRVVRGLLWRSDTVVPFGRVQHIDVDQGPLERFFRHCHADAAHRGQPQCQRGAARSGRGIGARDARGYPRPYPPGKPVSPDSPGLARRTAPLSVVTGTFAVLQNVIVPAIAIGISGIGGSGRFLLAVGMVVAAVVLGSVGGYLRWRRLTYTVGEADIRVESGILSRAARSVPYERIQDVSIEAKLVPRLLGLVAVKFETGGGRRRGISRSGTSPRPRASVCANWCARGATRNRPPPARRGRRPRAPMRTKARYCSGWSRAAC